MKMLERVLKLFTVGLSGLFAVSAQAAVTVEMTVEEPARVERKAEPVTSGIPFARGVLKDVSALSVSAAGRKQPAQFLKTVPWDDGSVRWALMDTQVDVPAGGKISLIVSDEGAGPAPATPVKVDDGADAVKVSTGPLTFSVSRKKFNIFESFTVDGKELISGSGEGLAVIDAAGVKVFEGGAPTSVKVEQAGPMRATVCVRGKISSIKGYVTYTMRITAYSGRKFVKIHTWLENGGAYGYNSECGWINFDGLALELPLGLGDTVKAVCEGVEAGGKFKVLQKSGGKHTFKDLNYAITSGEKELKKGERTDGVVGFSGPGGKLNVAIRNFWQNYEKAIELDGRTLKIWLWPTEGEWPRQGLKRGRSLDEFGQFRKAGLYALPGGSHKGHECILDFSGAKPEASAATLNQPLMAAAPATYYATTRAAPGWFAPMDISVGKADYDAKLKSWDSMARNVADPKHQGGLVAAANGAKEGFGFWYGWMDYGDLYWENGACNLHYDWPWIMLVDYMRSGGERKFFDSAVPMVQHRSDVDQTWSDRDMEMFRGVTRYERNSTDTHGDVDDGRSKPNVSHHWACGEVLYYMLTGDEKARECALRSAQGVKNRIDAGQPRSAGWGILLLCSVYDMTADKQYLDLAKERWEKLLMPKWKAAGDVTLGADGGKWYVQTWYILYPLCVFHEHTGNADVQAYLNDAASKCPVALPNPIESNHLSNLLGYVGYLNKNEEMIKRAEAAFMLSIPAGSPGIQGNHAWTKESAKKLRYGHLLEYFEWQAAQKK